MIFFEINLGINYSIKSLNAYSGDYEIYDGPIEHVFCHCLIAYPSIAKRKGNDMTSAYKSDCITPVEFQRVLVELHKRNYMLINPNAIIDNRNGIISKKQLMLPKGKKPLIFSFDDVNYDSKKQGKGMIDRLCLRNGKIISETNFSEKVDFSDDNEFVPILENFVKANPSFSHQGAKGLICLTGYDGIFGYRTQANSKIRNSEIMKAQQLANCLKRNGWSFASHSYGHYHMKRITDAKFETEIRKWKDEVESIVGKTLIYVYPYGEWEILANTKLISNKHKMLKDNGFCLFCGVGTKSFLKRWPCDVEENEKIIFMDRAPIDGNSLKNNSRSLARFFNASEIWDHKFRGKYIED